ncbi:hypothetical protein [Bacillus manliponensis]|uniref:hypothetical protein n=1 Tax=Bacillus manliponensis TaxID=574376 RepID=UPI000A948869|nr:hypothetical protein [Bacillus manliponensis]
MARKKKSCLYVIKETYGTQKREEVFRKVFENYYGVGTVITRKEKEELSKADYLQIETK